MELAGRVVSSDEKVIEDSKRELEGHSAVGSSELRSDNTTRDSELGQETATYEMDSNQKLKEDITVVQPSFKSLFTICC